MAKKVKKAIVKKVKKVKKKVEEAEQIDKKTELLALMKDINKEQKLDGKSALSFGISDIDLMSTGSQIVDSLIGGGVMLGRILTLMGPEKSGKTAFCIACIAADQAANPDSIWMWIDPENSTDKKWFAKLGLDPDRIILIEKLETMEEYCDTALKIIQRTDLISGVVLDSIGALMPQGEMYKKVKTTLVYKGLGADTMALLSRKLGQFLRGIKGLIAKRNIPMLAITHVYADVNNGGYLIPKGGNAFRHFSDLRLEFRVGPRKNWPFNEKVDDKEQYLGFEQVITLDKTKNYDSQNYRSQIGMPFISGKGWDEDRFFTQRAIRDSIILQTGSWFRWNSDMSLTAADSAEINVNGVKNFWKEMDKNPEMYKNIRKQYKDVNIFEEDSKPLVLLNEDEDGDIINAANVK